MVKKGLEKFCKCCHFCYKDVLQEFDPLLQNVFVEIAQEESIGENSQPCDNTPLINRPPDPYGAASPGDVHVPPPLAMPQEFDYDLQTVIEDIALQECREVNYPLSDNNPSRNQQHAQRRPSTGAFGAQLPMQVHSVPQDFDHDLQTVIEEIALQESREVNYPLSDNNSSRNQQQRGPSTVAFGAQPPTQIHSVPPIFENLQLRDIRNAPRTASPVVAASQLLMEVESKLEEFNQSLGEQALQIVVNRDNIVNNLICYYTDLVVPQSRVQVKMLGEDGMDAGGVMSDVYTTFWNKAKDQFFIGCEGVVPYLPAHKMVEEDNFRVLGRILSHSVALMKTIPIPLCTSTIIVMIYGTVHVPEKTLLKDFLLFIPSDDKSLVYKALSNFSSLSSKELGNLQSIFARYDYAGVIKESNFVNHLVQLASNEICRKPKHLCELMRAGIPSTHMNVFWSLLHPDHFSILYVVQKPTATAVIARLQIDRDSRNLSSGQQRAFQYLKDFVHELSPEDLETFVQFVTGKRSTPREPIIISFSTLQGYQRMPRVHTCSDLLELPATYENYKAFKNEFKHLLASDEAMMMTME